MIPETIPSSLPAEEPLAVSHRVRRIAARLERAAWPLCLALLTVWAIGYLGWPFSSDQGTLSWVGRVIADGGMPYRDAWEIRGPAPFLVYAAIARVFGTAQWPLRCVDLAIVVLGAICVARIASAFGGRTAARSAAALYVLWYASLGFHDTAQSDAWNAALMAGVALLMLARGGLPGAREAAAAGVLLGLSIFSKPPYAAFLLLPGIIGLAQVRQRGAGWLIRFWGAGVVAIAITAGVLLLWLRRGGALDAFVDIHIRWLLARYTDVESNWLNRAQTAALFLTSDIFATAVAPAILGVIAVWRRDRGYATMLLGWLAAALLTVMAQGNFYAYHWHPVYPVLAALAGIGVASIYHASAAPNDGRVRVVAVAVASAVFGAAALRPLVHAYRTAFLVAGVLPRERFDVIEFGPYGGTGPFAHLAGYIRAHTSPGESALIWGDVPGVYYVAGRHAPTRFGYTDPLVDPQDDEFRRRYRREFLARLDANPPAVVATLAPSICKTARTTEQRRLLGRTEERMICVEAFPELARLVAERYVADSAIGPIALFRRRDVSPTRSSNR